MMSGKFQPYVRQHFSAMNVLMKNEVLYEVQALFQLNSVPQQKQPPMPAITRR